MEITFTVFHFVLINQILPYNWIFFSISVSIIDVVIDPRTLNMVTGFDFN